MRQFLSVWEHESSQTTRVLKRLTDESLSRSVAPGHRDLGDLAWHITTALQEIAGRTGLEFDGPSKSTIRPDTARDLLDAYVLTAKSLARALAVAWSDETLAERHDLYGMEWQKGATLMVMVHHEIHHRGQMTVLMRQAGLTLPGVYGPSADEA